MAGTTAAPAAAPKKENKKAKAPPAVKPTVYYKGADVGSNAHGVPALGIFLVWAPVNQGGLALPPPTGGGAASGGGAGADGGSGPASGPDGGTPAAGGGGGNEPDLTTLGDLTLGFVDGWGYLQNVVPGRNPWSDVFQQLEDKKAAPAQTASQPMAEKLTYRIWPVAHPHPDRAQAALEHLRALRQQQLAKKAKQPAPPPAKPPAISGGPALDFGKLKSFDVKLEKKTEGKVDLLPIYLPAKADAYWPGGSEKYKHWLLYRNMPYASLPEVRDQVRRASFHLGALRYPTGAEHSPYLDNKSEGNLDDHPGWYSNTTMGSVDHLQQAVVAGEAFKMIAAPMPRKQDHPSSCAFLLGQDVTLAAAPAAAPSGPSPAAEAGVVQVAHKLKESDFFPGVIDGPTAEALHEWIAKGLRHRGDLLVVLKTNVWGQSPMVFAFWAWDAVIKALGCGYGLGISNTWRPFSTTPGAGQTDASNHALGLAIDLACDFDEDYTDRTTGRDRLFPVAFEATWIRDELPADRELKTREANLRKIEATFQDGAPAPEVTDAKIAEAQAKYDAAAKAKAPNTISLRKALAALQDLKKARASVEAGRKKVAEVLAAISPWKLEYELRFRLYGHTTLDAVGLPSAKLLEALNKAFGVQTAPPAAPDPNLVGPPVPPGILPVVATEGSSGYKLVDDYRAQLVKMFPATLTAEQAKVRDAVIDPPVNKLKALVEHLLALARQPGADAAADRSAFVDEFIRKTVRPFQSDGWSLDGGDSLPHIEAAKDAEDPKVMERYPLLKTTAKGWLNLSRLGWHLDMGNISGRNKDFKRWWNHPQHEKKSKTLETLTIDGKVADKPPPDDPYDDRTRRGALRRLALAIRKVQGEVPDYVVTVKGSADEEHPVKDFTDEMVTLMESWPPPANKLTEGLTLDGLELVVKVSGEPEKCGEQAKAVAEIFSAGKARVVGIGKHLKTDLAVDAIVAGADLQAGIKAATVVPPEPPPPDPKGKGKGKGKPSTLKLTIDQTLTLRPVLAPKAPDLWGTKFLLPAAGTPKGFEWWHFEHADRKGPWVANMAQVGVSQRVLTSPGEPSGLDGIVVPGPDIGGNRGNYPFPSDPGNDPPYVPDGG